jgi:hypothetical protein
MTHYCKECGNVLEAQEDYGSEGVGLYVGTCEHCTSANCGACEDEIYNNGYDAGYNDGIVEARHKDNREENAL